MMTCQSLFTFCNLFPDLVEFSCFHDTKVSLPSWRALFFPEAAAELCEIFKMLTLWLYDVFCFTLCFLPNNFKHYINPFDCHWPLRHCFQKIIGNNCKISSLGTTDNLALILVHSQFIFYFAFINTEFHQLLSSVVIMQAVFCRQIYFELTWAI